MEQQKTLNNIADRANALGLSVRAICIASGVHPTSFSRWRASERNPEPTEARLSTLRLITSKLDELECERSPSKSDPQAHPTTIPLSEDADAGRVASPP